MDVADQIIEEEAKLFGGDTARADPVVLYVEKGSISDRCHWPASLNLQKHVFLNKDRLLAQRAGVPKADLGFKTRINVNGDESEVSEGHDFCSRMV